jgi:phage terminase small subunit
MPILRNPRHEAFAQALVSGMSLGQANVAAGYRNSNRKAAWITRQNPKIAARITELTEDKLVDEKLAREKAKVKLDITTERTIAEIAKIAFANMLDYVRFDDQGQPHFDLVSLRYDQGSAIQELIIDEYVDGRGKGARQVKRVRVKLASKIDALNSLGKHLGLFVDPSALNLTQHNYFSERAPTMAEWRKEIELEVEATSSVPQPPCKR